ncbi:unnamed protein product [Chilo suppressalis]|uniref:WD repeat-containing protein 55 homolog n=1 Tax=Chilo suppressalis TaxID=168631 RepID=A0ABN8B664_CHISP|nr:unnamed protein product [Chilo suppressalis]
MRAASAASTGSRGRGGWAPAWAAEPAGWSCSARTWCRSRGTARCGPSPRSPTAATPSTTPPSSPPLSSTRMRSSSPSLVSPRGLKVFEYEAVVRDAVDVHYPCAEMQCAHKVSCVTWNQYHKNVLASADYEGCVCVWDASTGQRTRALQEHDKRAWSVHFNRADVRLLASGSDDARVKLWALNAERSVATLEAKFNVCCVRFNPRSSCHLAYGSADHCVHYYDLRAPRHPLQVFRDHRKAVSYVQFVDARSLVSASTDSQLKLWRVDSPRCVRSFSGHANEKNFVGLATDGTYLACGSENNALYVYYKGLSRPLLAYRFEAVRGFLEKERRDEEPADFVSAVCWRRERPDRALLAANSQGTIKVLELV